MTQLLRLIATFDTSNGIFASELFLHSLCGLFIRHLTMGGPNGKSANKLKIYVLIVPLGASTSVMEASS